MGISTSTAQYFDEAGDRSLVSVRTVAKQVVMASYEASSLTLEQYAKLAIDYSKTGSELRRKAATRRRIDFLRDSWGPILKAALINWLPPETLDNQIGKDHNHLDLSRNPAKIIWRQLAVSYKRPPKRYTPNNPSDGERYLELLDRSNLDNFWQLCEIYLEVCNDIFIWPSILEINGQIKFKHKVVTGDSVSLITMEDDPTEIECIVIDDHYTTLDGTEVSRWIVWTHNWHAVFEQGEDGLVPVGKALTGNPELDYNFDNPYGMIPIIPVRKTNWQDGLLDVTSEEDLVDLTIHGGIDRSRYRYLQKLTGHKQPIISGDIEKGGISGVLDPQHAIKIHGTDVSVDVVDWSVLLSERQECLSNDELAAAASRGINPESYKRSGNYQTAQNAKLSERGLSEHRESMVPTWVAAEQEYYRIFAIMAKVHGIPNPPDPDAKIEIEHAPISYPTDPQQQLAVDKEELALGLVSRSELIQRRHPSWTREQCDEYLEKVLTEQAHWAEVKASRQIPNDPTNGSLIDETNGSLGPLVRDSNDNSGDPADSEIK